MIHKLNSNMNINTINLQSSALLFWTLVLLMLTRLYYLLTVYCYLIFTSLSILRHFHTLLQFVRCGSDMNHRLHTNGMMGWRLRVHTHKLRRFDYKSLISLIKYSKPSKQGYLIALQSDQSMLDRSNSAPTIIR